MLDEYAKTIMSLKGDIGKKWLDRIPEIIKKYEEKWSLKVLSPFSLSYNYVSPVVLSNGTHAVFKINLHGAKQFNAEHDALRLFNGDGVIRLLKADVEDSVLLLERVEPGKPVSEIEDDDKATRAIISVMKKLWKPAPADHNFVSLNDWYKGFARLRNMFDGKTGPFA